MVQHRNKAFCGQERVLLKGINSDNISCLYFHQLRKRISCPEMKIYFFSQNETRFMILLIKRVTKMLYIYRDRLNSFTFLYISVPGGCRQMHFWI